MALKVVFSGSTATARAVFKGQVADNSSLDKGFNWLQLAHNNGIFKNGFLFVCAKLFVPLLILEYCFWTETPRLTHETFRALKPGLSAYADDVEKVI